MKGSSRTDGLRATITPLIVLLPVGTISSTRFVLIAGLLPGPLSRAPRLPPSSSFQTCPGFRLLFGLSDFRVPLHRPNPDSNTPSNARLLLFDCRPSNRIISTLYIDWSIEPIAGLPRAPEAKAYSPFATRRRAISVRTGCV